MKNETQNNDNNQNYLIDNVFKILKQNGIEEDIETAFQKTEENKLSFVVETAKAINEFSSGKFLEKDFPKILQQKLEIPKEQAEKLFLDIKKEILSSITIETANTIKTTTEKISESAPIKETVIEKPTPQKSNGPDKYREVV